MKYWNHSVTVYHRVELPESERWIRYVYADAFFKSKLEKSVQGNSLSAANSFLVRLPKYAVIAEGDVIVNGNIQDDITADFSIAKLLQKYKNNSFRVRLCADNTRFNPAHIKCEG